VASKKSYCSLFRKIYEVPNGFVCFVFSKPSPTAYLPQWKLSALGDMNLLELEADELKIND
jgi:hypothetical protein